MVLRNMAILSTPRNVYVNITLSNMVALFWLSPSSENRSCKTPGIFGKRICRVTKEDILRDAKVMEEEAKEEANALQASLQPEIEPHNMASNSRNLMSPTSSTSSVPSSIKAPMNNIQGRIYNRNNQGNYTPTHRPYFRPDLSSSPACDIKRNRSAIAESNFRRPTPHWQPRASFNRDVTAPSGLSRYNGVNMGDNNSAQPSSVVNEPSRQYNSKQTNYMPPNFKFNPATSSSPCFQQDSTLDQKNSAFNNISDNSSSLLEGLDEDSLFGDF